MPRRKLLKGIIGGIASGFASRNNDLDGYWTLGILYKIASDSGTNQFTLNLATGESTPEYKYSGKIAVHYYESLLRQITKLGFTSQVIKNAIVEIEFDIPSSESPIKPEWLEGNLFVCKAIIVDDLNRIWSADYSGWCRQHDPKKESRSLRRFFS